MHWLIIIVFTLSIQTDCADPDQLLQSATYSNVTVEKKEMTFFPDRGSNLPGRWTQSPILYRFAIKASLYRKAVQVYHIPIPDDILPLQLAICP